MDDDQNFDAPEDDNIVGGEESEVPEDDEDSDDAEGDESAEETDDEGVQGKEKGESSSRSNVRIRNLSSERKAERERADKAEREVADLRRQMEQVQRSLHVGNAVKDAQAEQELLAQMDPVQRVQYEADKKINAVNAELQRVKLTAEDSRDKAEFLAEFQGEPTLARLAPEVEKTLADMRSKGYNVPRRELFALALGKDLLARKAKTGGKNPDKRAAEARVNATAGRSSSVRGDASSGRKGKTAEERLENVIL